MYDTLERNNGRKAGSRKHDIALRNILSDMTKLVRKSVAQKVDKKPKLQSKF